MLRRIWDNTGTLLMALILAALVWVVAVVEENPLEERDLAPVPITLVGKPDNLMIIGGVTANAQVRLSAPRLTWPRLTPRQVQVTADLSNLGPGTHEIELQASTTQQYANILTVEPGQVTITLEQSASREIEVEVTLLGQPATGYEAEQPQLSSETVTVSGAAPAVARVAGIQVRQSIEGLRTDFRGPVTFAAVDADGSPVTGVALEPETAQLIVPITQREGYRDVAVKLIITGQVASGYQVTNIAVSPNFITVASSDPRLVNQMPGFVETEPLDISEATDDVVRRLPLELPPGVTVDGEQSVLAQVSISAIEYTLRVERQLEMRGLPPGLSATISPDTVDVLLLGPLAVLDDLSLEDVRIVVNLEGLDPGTHQVTPVAEVLPEGLRADIVLDQVEVVVVFGTPTPTPSPTIELTPTPSPTSTPTPRPTSPPWTATPSPMPTDTETPTP